MEKEYEELKKSKSQVKRELLELQSLGKQLASLSVKQLVAIPVSNELREAIFEVKSMKHSALKRQLKFIGGLMQKEDELAIRSALEELKSPHKDEVGAFHEVEQWRDCLLQGDQALINDLADKFENFERQYVNQLIRNTKKEQENNKPPRSARSLFKYLTELQGN